MGKLRSISTLMLLNGAGTVVAVANSAVVAHFFGTMRVLELFFAASTLVTLMVSLTQTGQLTEILIPMYHRLREREGRASAVLACSVICNWMVVAVTVLAGCLCLAAPRIVSLLVPGFGAGDQAKVVLLFRCLAPVIPLQVASALQLGMANAERRFGKPEVWNVAAHVASLALTAALASIIGTWALVVSLWASNVIVIGGYWGVLRRVGWKHHWILFDPRVRVLPVFAQLATTFTYVGATQVYGFVLNAALSLLPQGVYAVFNYVLQVYSKMSGLVLRPVSTVFFTQFSEEATRSAARGVRSVKEGLSRTLAVGSAAAVVGVSAGECALSGLWGSSRFGAENLQLASHLLWWLLCLLVVSGQGTVWRKYAVSLGLLRVTYLSGAASQVVCAAVLAAAVKMYGLCGLVCGVTFAVLCLNASAALPLGLTLRRVPPTYVAVDVAKWIGVGSMTVLLVGGLGRLVGWDSSARVAASMLAALQVVLAIACIVVVGLWFRIPECELVSAIVKEKWAGIADQSKRWLNARGR